MVLEKVKPPELEEDFVYDVYYSHSELNLLDKQDLSVFQCLAPEDFEPEAAYESDLGLDDDDSDSNAEDNWRNDYPDEETDFERQLDYYGDYSDDGGTDFVSDRVRSLCLDIGWLGQAGTPARTFRQQSPTLEPSASWLHRGILVSISAFFTQAATRTRPLRRRTALGARHRVTVDRQMKTAGGSYQGRFESPPTPTA
ncbi:hypothetical protein HPB47_008854 [Ixodes persulcatus]|uniref:Uncharacterized protein n=1 Tax=Ixodes persulcatus TaxID=34615 RepID=A0AC60P3N4_IXOPE|nr:hypothetical protein HPB47_008854 [Ixodes persulcatus]